MRLLKASSLLLLLSLVACDKASDSQLPKPSYDQKNAQSIAYVRDDRTGLCFVLSYVSEYPIGTATIYSHVPCTDRVEKLVK